MRLYLGIAVLIIVMLAVSIHSLNAMIDTADIITADIDNIYEKVDNNNWEAAYSELSEVKNYWNRHKTWWPWIVDNREIDVVDSSFIKVEQYVKYQKQGLASSELLVLKHSIKDIPQKHVICLENIL